jgi:hypothetical protein
MAAGAVVALPMPPDKREHRKERPLERSNLAVDNSGPRANPAREHTSAGWRQPGSCGWAPRLRPRNRPTLRVQLRPPAPEARRTRFEIRSPDAGPLGRTLRRRSDHHGTLLDAWEPRARHNKPDNGYSVRRNRLAMSHRRDSRHSGRQSLGANCSQKTSRVVRCRARSDVAPQTALAGRRGARQISPAGEQTPGRRREIGDLQETDLSCLRTCPWRRHPSCRSSARCSSRREATRLCRSCSRRLRQFPRWH